jgi:hypothetical protein
MDELEAKLNDVVRASRQRFNRTQPDAHVWFKSFADDVAEFYPNQPGHKVFERLCPDIFCEKFYPKHNIKIKGLHSKTPRQVDVGLYDFSEKDRKLSAIAEAKLHSSRLNVKHIDELCGKMADVGVPKAYLISSAGFSKSARVYAKSRGIELMKLDPADVLLGRIRIWENYRCRECNPKESLGLVDWEVPETPWLPAFGRCNSCATEYFFCPYCADVQDYDSDTSLVAIECPDCCVYARRSFGCPKEPSNRSLFLGPIECNVLRLLADKASVLEDKAGDKLSAQYNKKVIARALKRLEESRFIVRTGEHVTKSENFWELLSGWGLQDIWRDSWENCWAEDEEDDMAET